MATLPTNAAPFLNDAEQLHRAASDATERHHCSPLARTTEEGHLDNIAACPAGRETAGHMTPGEPPSTDIPPFAIGAESRSPTRENSPTRYEEYRTTLFGRKLQKTEKVKAAGGWKKLHASARPQAANRRTLSSRRHRGIRKSCGSRLQAAARNQFLDEDGCIEFPDIGRLARLTAAEKKELDEAIRLSK